MIPSNSPEAVRSNEVDKLLGKKFDGKGEPKVITGDDLRKQINANVPGQVYEPAVSTTANEAVDIVQTLRNIIMQCGDSIASLKVLMMKRAEIAERLQPVLEVQVAMVEDLNIYLKELLGDTATKES